MQATARPLRGSPETRGLWLGLLGVAIFAMTLPMTRLAVGPAQAPQLPPLFVTAGRAALAALLSVAFLLFRRAALPPRRLWPTLAVSAAGTVIGFPLLLALALREVPAMHAAVVTGLLPLATAAIAALTMLSWPTRAASPSAWAGFAYVGLFSMWLGFFAWYRELALGGTVRVSQVQLLQPFLALLFAVPVLGEALQPATLMFSLAVIASVAAGRRMPVHCR
jgi:drug/metabolite transporter (DMT)-like permease